MKRSVMIVLLLSASSVFAQEETNEVLPQPPPATQVELPPILAVPPGYPPPVAVPAAERIRALEESAHEKRTAGAVLQTAGGITAFAGVALLVAASWSDDGACSRNDDHRTWAVESYTSGSPSGSHSTPPSNCGDGALAIAGAVTFVLGVAMILPGVAVMRSGIGDLARAEQLRRTHGIEWSLRPRVGAHGGHVELAMRF